MSDHLRGQQAMQMPILPHREPTPHPVALDAARLLSSLQAEALASVRTVRVTDCPIQFTVQMREDIARFGFEAVASLSINGDRHDIRVVTDTAEALPGAVTKAVAQRIAEQVIGSHGARAMVRAMNEAGL